VIEMVNTQTEKIFGYAREELVGLSIEVLVPERARASHPGHRHGYFAHATTRAMGAGRELFGRRRDGSEVPVEIGLNPINTPDGLFVLASIVDISARKQAEQETQRLQREITHVSRVTTIGQLASALAHEINQPLGAILRNAEAAELFLQHDSPDLDEIRAILADIRKDDQRASAVIDRMRTLLRRHELATQPLNVAEFVGDVVALTRPDAAAREVKLEVELPAGLPRVNGDRVHLQQVLLNLIVNGMDAFNGGTEDSKCITVGARLDGEQVVEIAVSDSGPGVPADKLPHIFDPFFTTKQNGLGMGLAISRTIIEAHGGRLWAENNEGRGATFRFTLKTTEDTAVS
jgi:two-component system sensor kinase FixL